MVSEDTQNLWTKAKWVWPDAKGLTNQYVQFRQEFDLDFFEDDADLLISCEGNFTAFLNGKLVATGQFTDYPDKPTFSQVNISKHLKEGKNVISILGYHFGIEHFSNINGDAALIFAIRTGAKLITSGCETMFRQDSAYTCGEMDRITSQMGFVFEFDAQNHDNWIDSEYSCGESWQNVSDKDVLDMPAPVSRPLPMLELKTPSEMKIIAQGQFVRSESDKKQTFAELMQSDYLSAKRAAEFFEFFEFFKFFKFFKKGEVDCELINRPVVIKSEMLCEQGVYVIVDAGCEECGFISLDVEAPAGTVIDIAVGEHLEDMRVRASVGGRNFASRYICGNGRQHFTHYNNRYAGRYVQLHISQAVGGAVKLNYAGIVPFEYPIVMSGKFESPDSLMNRIYEVSRRTLHLCMHEHYEDCPWREQALYANDSRNQALSGYYAFGEYDFPRVSFDLLGRSVRDDNYLTLTAPSRAVDFTIPSFTMTWFMEMDDYLLFSGDRTFAESYLPQIQQMLDSYIDSCDEGLLPCPKGKAYWHFYDWAKGLEGADGGGWKTVKSDRFDAVLNLFFAMALRAGARIAQKIGNEELAEKYEIQADVVEHAVDERFWVESEQAYQTYLGEEGIDNHFCELVQALAILGGTSDPQRSDMLRKRLVMENNGLVETTLSQSLYKFEALCGDIEKYGVTVFEMINNYWSGMLFSRASSFWETLKGHFDFDYAGSLCHGWSAIPVYFYQAYLLGIKPLESGFKKFSLSPFTGFIDKTAGKVITPSGLIEVKWQNIAEKTVVKVTHPSDLECVIESDDEKFVWEINSDN